MPDQRAHARPWRGLSRRAHRGRLLHPNPARLRGGRRLHRRAWVRLHRWSRRRLYRRCAGRFRLGRIRGAHTRADHRRRLHHPHSTASAARVESLHRRPPQTNPGPVLRLPRPRHPLDQRHHRAARRRGRWLAPSRREVAAQKLERIHSMVESQPTKREWLLTLLAAFASFAVAGIVPLILLYGPSEPLAEAMGGEPLSLGAWSIVAIPLVYILI